MERGYLTDRDLIILLFFSFLILDNPIDFLFLYLSSDTVAAGELEEIVSHK